MIHMDIISFEDGVVTAKVKIADGTGRVFSIKFHLEKHEIYACNIDINDPYVKRAVYGLYWKNVREFHNNLPESYTYAWF